MPVRACAHSIRREQKVQKDAAETNVPSQAGVHVRSALSSSTHVGALVLAAFSTLKIERT